MTEAYLSVTIRVTDKDGNTLPGHAQSILMQQFADPENATPKYRALLDIANDIRQLHDSDPVRSLGQWHFERSSGQAGYPSGYAGYRCEKCREWRFERDRLSMVCKCDHWADKELQGEGR